MQNSSTLFLLFLFLLLLCSTSTAMEMEEIWIDVRSEKEYNQSHLAGAVNLPLSVINERIDKLAKNKNTSLKLYCRSGRRSELAKKMLVDLGYQDVINSGGINSLVRQGIKNIDEKFRD